MNSFDGIVDYGKYARSGVLNDCKRVQDVQNEWSFGLLIVMVGMLAMFIIVIIPFMIMINRELASMLSYLVGISHSDVKVQLTTALLFLHDIQGTENNMHESLYEKKADLPEEDDKIPLNEAQDITHDVPQEAHTIVAEKAQDRREIQTQAKTYTPHKQDVWKIFAVLIVCAGAMVGLYVGYDSYAKNMSNIIAYQSDELYRVCRSQSYNAFVSGYTTHYIASNKTASCAGSPCGDYIQSHVSVRFTELNDFMIFHKGNMSFLTPSYRQLFVSLIQDNPCERVSYFASLPSCNTTFGGIFTKGAYATTIKLLDIYKSLVKDFQKSSASQADILRFLNDQRMLELEQLHLQFLEPAFALLIEQLKKDSKTTLSLGNMVAIIYSVVMSAFLIGVSVVGSRSLLLRIRRAMYDTKAMLSNLPPAIIHSNPQIMQFLVASTQTLTTAQYASLVFLLMLVLLLIQTSPCSTGSVTYA